MARENAGHNFELMVTMVVTEAGCVQGVFISAYTTRTCMAYCSSITVSSSRLAGHVKDPLGYLRP